MTCGKGLKFTSITRIHDVPEHACFAWPNQMKYTQAHAAEFLTGRQLLQAPFRATPKPVLQRTVVWVHAKHQSTTNLKQLWFQRRLQHSCVHQGSYDSAFCMPEAFFRYCVVDAVASFQPY